MKYDELFRLDGRCALITGGTGGLGREIAAAFMSVGARVAVCGTHPERAEPGCTGIRCNICDEESVNSMMDTITEEFGTLDILVNCAGKNILKPAENYDTSSFLEVMSLNLTAVHLVTREAGRRFMIPKRSGRILNISSVKSLIGTDKDYLAYCTSKGALNMYTKQLACEWGKYNINVNAIAPTFVRTAINSFQLDDPEFYDSLLRRIPLGRTGSKQDIAATALFLCSEASSFITGQVLCADGGLTARQ